MGPVGPIHLGPGPRLIWVYSFGPSARPNGPSLRFCHECKQIERWGMSGTSRRWDRALSSDVLPQPLGPRIAKTRPLLACADVPRRITREEALWPSASFVRTTYSTSRQARVPPMASESAGATVVGTGRGQKWYSNVTRCPRRVVGRANQNRYRNRRANPRARPEAGIQPSAARRRRSI